MHNRFGAAAAVLSLAVANMIYHIIVIFDTLRPLGRKGSFEAAVANIAAVAAAGLILPGLLGLVRRRDGPTPAERSRRNAWVAAGLICLSPLLRCFGLNAWLTSDVVRFLIVAGLGVSLVVGYCLFFALVPPERRGLWFGMVVTAGVAGRFCIDKIVQTMEPADALGTIYYLVLALSIGIALAQLFGLRTLLKNVPSFSPAASGDGGDFRIVLCLLAATGLFFLLNGLQAGRLYPYFDPYIDKRFALLPLFVAVATPLAGWLFDRDFGAWFKRLVWPCALLFMFVPVLPVLTDRSPALYQLIHSLAVVAHFVLLVGVTVAVDRFCGRGAFWCLAIMAPHFSRVLSFAWVVLERADLTLELGTRMVLSILAAVAFYELVRLPLTRFALARNDAVNDGFASVQPSPAEPPVVAEAPAEATAGQGRSTTAMFRKFRLTDREAEVAGLLLKGVSTADMAKTLFISEVTVRFHVKNILHKCNTGNRRVFQAKAFSGELWEEAAEKESD